MIAISFNTFVMIPEHRLNIVAKTKIDLENVNCGLPEADTLATETAHQVFCQEVHACVRLGSEVGQNVLQNKYFRSKSQGWDLLVFDGCFSVPHHRKSPSRMTDDTV